MAMARSMQKERRVPEKYWGEAVRHAVYVLNKLPTRSLSFVTPHEFCFGRKPSVESLKIFGCTAYMKVPAVHITKLDDRSKLVVHFGRGSGMKGYRLYDPVSGNIYISRDVIFNESKGWDWEIGLHSKANGTCHFTLEDSTLNMPTQSTSEALDLSPITPQTSMHLSSSSQTNTEDTVISSIESEDSEQPRHFRYLDEIYDNTTEVELAKELLHMSFDEPVCFEQAVKDNV